MAGSLISASSLLRRGRAKALQGVLVLAIPGRSRRLAFWSLVMVGLVANLFGFIGWVQYRADRPEDAVSWMTVVFRTGALFTGDSGVAFEVPVLLSIGRLLALATLSFGIVHTAAGLGEERLRPIAARSAVGHTVLIGPLDSCRRAAQLLGIDLSADLVVHVPTGDRSLDGVHLGRMLALDADPLSPAFPHAVNFDAASMVLIAPDDDPLARRLVARLVEDRYRDAHPEPPFPTVRVVTVEPRTARRLLIRTAVLTPGVDVGAISVAELASRAFIAAITAEMRTADVVCVLTGAGAAEATVTQLVISRLQQLAVQKGWDRPAQVVILDPMARPDDRGTRAFSPIVQIRESLRSSELARSARYALIGSIESDSDAGYEVEADARVAFPDAPFIDLDRHSASDSGGMSSAEVWAAVAATASRTRPLAASDVRQFIEFLARHRFDIVVTDVRPQPLRLQWYVWMAQRFDCINAQNEAHGLCEAIQSHGFELVPPTDNPPAESEETS